MQLEIFYSIVENFVLNQDKNHILSLSGQTNNLRFQKLHLPMIQSRTDGGLSGIHVYIWRASNDFFPLIFPCISSSCSWDLGNTKFQFLFHLKKWKHRKFLNLTSFCSDIFLSSSVTRDLYALRKKKILIFHTNTIRQHRLFLYT